jgi:hypothetical protein
MANTYVDQALVIYDRATGTFTPSNSLAQSAILGAVAVYDEITGMLGPGGPLILDIARVATVSLTSAQLLALHATPVQILPAPGPGLYNWPIAYAMEYIFGGIAYSSPAHTNDCFITYGNPPAASTNELVIYAWANAASGIIEATQSCIFQGVCGNGLITLSIAENAPVMFSAPDALTLGNGTLNISVSYSTLKA